MNNLPAETKPPDNFVNLHKATVEVRMFYNKQAARPGYRWYVWNFKFVKRFVNKKGKIQVDKRTRIGGVMIEKSFEATHGENNVKRMIIQNIVNKEKRD